MPAPQSVVWSTCQAEWKNPFDFVIREYASGWQCSYQGGQYNLTDICLIAK